ncbi:MAG: hypothetical protein BGO41_01680 [Clostridiales bacterium 38-18]|nr:MAG: hypothetical protein BGO41_01680 [Clostridiales bacterium 38-18]
MSQKNIIFKYVSLIFLFSLILSQVNFADTLIGISKDSNYYFNGQEYAPMRVYDVKSSDDAVKQLVLLRDLATLGYELKWLSESREIIVNSASPLNPVAVPKLNQGLEVKISDITTRIDTYELQTYTVNGMAMVDISQMPYTYFAHLPDSWARPYFYLLNAIKVRTDSNLIFTEKATVGNFSDSIRQTLSHYLPEKYTTGMLPQSIKVLKEDTDETKILTRELAAALTVEVLKVIDPSFSTVKADSRIFTDGASIDASMLDAMTTLYQANVLSTNLRGEIAPKKEITLQEAMVILAKSLMVYMKETPPYAVSTKKEDISEFEQIGGIYQVGRNRLPISLNNSGIRLSIYDVFLEESDEILSLVIDQDYVHMGGVYALEALYPQVFSATVIMSNGERIEKNMGRMVSYDYLGKGIFRTYLQIAPPIAEMNASSRLISKDEITKVILHGPQHFELAIDLIE